LPVRIKNQQATAMSAYGAVLPIYDRRRTMEQDLENMVVIARAISCIYLGAAASI
jgi:hypothetical protein